MDFFSNSWFQGLQVYPKSINSSWKGFITIKQLTTSILNLTYLSITDIALTIKVQLQNLKRVLCKTSICSTLCSIILPLLQNAHQTFSMKLLHESNIWGETYTDNNFVSVQDLQCSLAKFIPHISLCQWRRVKKCLVGGSLSCDLKVLKWTVYSSISRRAIRARMRGFQNILILSIIFTIRSDMVSCLI